MSAEVDLADWRSAVDPYQLDPAGVREPPVGWRASLRHLGPGMILSASIVGSGELIATTTAGAEAGFVLLWLVLFSCAVKVAVQVEFARWTIVTGQPALAGFNRVPPHVGRLGWINVLFAVMVVSKVLQISGIVGGVAIACSILLPIGGDALGEPSQTIWHVVVVALTIAVLHTSRYRLVERGAIVLVAIFSVMTVAIAFGLPFTPWGYSLNELASGFTFSLPAATVGAAVAMFGITGVGADEITMYNYWCIEKGYARFTGPNDGSEAWRRRARGWIGVMYKDAGVSMVVYTFSTVAFFLMGAAVLHRQQLVPRGNEMITTLARMYTDALGPWAMAFFLVGAVAVLGSTLWASVPSHSRMYANWIAVAGGFAWRDRATRIRWVRGFGIALPILWGSASLLLRQPVLMVQIGGVMTGVFLLAVLVATWYLRRRDIDPRLYGGAASTLLFVVSTIAIGLLGAYTALSTLGLVTLQ